MYENSTFPKIDIGSDDLSQIEATWLLTPPACRFWEGFGTGNFKTCLMEIVNVDEIFFVFKPSRALVLAPTN